MPVDHSLIKFLTNLHTLFSFVTLRLPTTALDYVKQVLPGAVGVIANNLGKGNLNTTELTRLQEQYDLLLNDIAESERKEREKEVEKKRFNKYGFTMKEEETLHGMEPPDNFRNIPIIPTVEEIMSIEEPFLRTNKKTGAYLDANHYLDVQYRLLREDFVSPLKRGIQDFIKYK